MKLAALALLVACAAPARADVSIRLPPTWRDQCAQRIDEAALKTGLKAGARRDAIPLLREDGTPNPMQLVEYGAPDAVTAEVGNETERRRNKFWTVTGHAGGKPFQEWFRRAHGMFAKLTLSNPALLQPFKAALDDCLKMGEPK